MSPLPRTAMDYVVQLVKTYVTAATDDPRYLVVYTSPILFTLYSEECKYNARVCCNREDSPVFAYHCRNARVKEDPDLRGFNIRYLEDEYAYKH